MIQQFQAGLVLVWRHHDMPAGVRVAVHHHKYPFSPRHDQIFRIVRLHQRSAKNTIRVRFVIHDVLHAPGRPQVFHTAPEIEGTNLAVRLSSIVTKKLVLYSPSIGSTRLTPSVDEGILNLLWTNQPSLDRAFFRFRTSRATCAP